MSDSLWQQLKQQDIVSGDEPQLLEESPPWYLRAMLSIAGWFGALFLLGAVFVVMDSFVDSAFTAGVLGGCACLLAVLIYSIQQRNDFLEQFAFAVSLAGQCLVVFSLLSSIDLNDSAGHLHTLALITLALQALLFCLIPNYLHRMWSALLMTASAMFLMNFYGLYPFTLSILLAMSVVLWTQEFRWVKLGNQLPTFAYSLVFISLILLFTQTFLWPQVSYDVHVVFGVLVPVSEFSEQLAMMLLGAVLVMLVFVVLRRSQVTYASSVGVGAVLLSLLIAYLCLELPGITVGMILVLLGFSHSNRILIGLGLVTLVVFVFQFYYLLALSLLYKSGLLMVSGVVLLLVRQLMKQLWPLQRLDDA